MIEIINWARGLSEIENVLDGTEVKRLGDIPPLEFEAWFVREMRKVGFASSDQVIDTKDGVPFGQQRIA